MLKETRKINDIPCLIWGDKSDKVFIAVHGNFSHKEDTAIELLAREADNKGYQVLSFDLPEHGDRQQDDLICKPQVVIKELIAIIEYAKKNWNDLNLFA